MQIHFPERGIRMHHAHYHAPDDLRTPKYSRSSTVGLGLMSVMALLALALTFVVFGF
jgi:hypothetical protein